VRLTAAERRAAILDAALDLFSAAGYETTSTTQITAAAGVTKPVLYDHFDSKQALYVDLVDREAARMSTALTSSFDPTASLEERLRALASSAVAFARGNLASVQLLLQEPHGDPVVLAPHRRAREAGRRAFAAAILADPLFDATPGLSRRASAELLGDLQSAVLERLVRWAAEKPRAPAGALVEVFVELLLPCEP
jgi:AcrR family transcriptional regulator